MRGGCNSQRLQLAGQYLITCPAVPCSLRPQYLKDAFRLPELLSRNRMMRFGLHPHLIYQSVQCHRSAILQPSVVRKQFKCARQHACPTHSSQTRLHASRGNSPLDIDTPELLVGDGVSLTCFALYKQIAAIVTSPNFPGRVNYKGSVCTPCVGACASNPATNPASCCCTSPQTAHSQAPSCTPTLTREITPQATARKLQRGWRFRSVAAGWLAPLNFNPLRFAEFANFAGMLLASWVVSAVLTGAYSSSRACSSVPAALTAVSRAWLVSMPVAAAQLVLVTAAESHAWVGEEGFASVLPLAASGPGEPLATGMMGVMRIV